MAPYEDGFLLSEVALGEGMLDIPGTAKGLQQRDPNTIFALEMITREPLNIPVFTKKYGRRSTTPTARCPAATWPGSWRSSATSQEAAHDHGRPEPADALKLEDDLINRSIAYARKNLSL